MTPSKRTIISLSVVFSVLFILTLTTLLTITLSPHPPQTPITATQNESDKAIVIFGGANNGTFQDTIELFYPNDSSRNTILSNTLPHGLAGASAVVYENKIYIFGGENENGSSSTSFIVDVATWSIEVGPKLMQERAYSAAILFNDTAYLCGGQDDTKKKLPLASCEILKLNAAHPLTFERIADMEQARKHLSMATDGVLIFVMGGIVNEDWASRNVERYDRGTNKWMKINPMRHKRTGAAAAVFDDRFVICGGWIPKKDKVRTSCEFYNSKTHQWEKFPRLTAPRFGHSMLQYGGTLVAVGGCNETSVEVYDSDLKMWTQFNETLIEERCFATAVVVKI